jgi:hypothetical protein
MHEQSISRNPNHCGSIHKNLPASRRIVTNMITVKKTVTQVITNIRIYRHLPKILTHYLYMRPSVPSPHSLCRQLLLYIPLLHFQQVKGKSQSPKPFPPSYPALPSHLLQKHGHPLCKWFLWSILSFTFLTSESKIPIHYDDAMLQAFCIPNKKWKVTFANTSSCSSIINNL